jgi:hypothetical protein
MSDSKIVHLFPASSKGSSGKGRRKRGIEPEFECRLRSELRISSGPSGASYHYYEKLRCVFHYHGLRGQIVIDESGAILAGARLFKDLEFNAHLVPVVVLRCLLPQEKAACRSIDKHWQQDLARKRAIAEERNYE